MGWSWFRWLRRRDRRDSVPAQEPRRLVVGDIHGCSRTLRALLVDEMRITTGDELYLLGDLVSKGPDSLGVLRFVSELSEAGVRVTIVRGNHEEAILTTRRSGNGRLRSLLEKTNNAGLLDGDGDVDDRWMSLMAESVYFVILPDAILVHGGIDMTVPQPFADGTALVNRRDTVYDAVVAGHRPVIHGHTRRPLSSIIESLVNDQPVLPLDNGAVGASSRKPFKISEYGNLCCLDLDHWRLHIQPNRDMDDDEYGYAAFSVTITPARSSFRG